MLFAGWEVRMVKNCDRGLENAARSRRKRAAFSSPRSQFFTIRTGVKVIPQYCIAHPYCARYLHHLRAHISACAYKNVREFPQTKLDS